MYLTSTRNMKTGLRTFYLSDYIVYIRPFLHSLYSLGLSGSLQRGLQRGLTCTVVRAELRDSASGARSKRELLSPSPRGGTYHHASGAVPTVLPRKGEKKCVTIFIYCVT